MNYNLSIINIANASAGIGFKHAPRNESITFTGFGTIKRPDRESGEIKEISILAAENGTIYSGDSIVMAGRLEDIYDAVCDEENGVPLKIVGHFADIKCAKGSATTIVIEDIME